MSKPIWNSVKISVVNVWKRRISKVPNSASRISATSREPPRSAGRIWCSVTRHERANASEPEPARDLLEVRVGARSAAATGRYTSG